MPFPLVELRLSNLFSVVADGPDLDDKPDYISRSVKIELTPDIEFGSVVTVDGESDGYWPESVSYKMVPPGEAKNEDEKEWPFVEKVVNLSAPEVRTSANSWNIRITTTDKRQRASNKVVETTLHLTPEMTGTSVDILPFMPLSVRKEQELIARGPSGLSAFQEWRIHNGDPEATLEDYFAWIRSVAKDDADRAELAATDAYTYLSQASDARDEAVEALDLAEIAQTNSETAQTLSELARDNAVSAKTAAETAQVISEDARDEALSAQEETGISQGFAEAARTDAEGFRDDTLVLKNQVSESVLEAESFATDAHDSSKSASESATDAETAASQAAGSASAAGVARDGAVAASSAAETSATQAGNHAVDASTAASAASGHADDASTSADDADTAREAAVVAQDAAEQARDDAGSSASDAAGSASSAAQSLNAIPGAVSDQLDEQVPPAVAQVVTDADVPGLASGAVTAAVTAADVPTLAAGAVSGAADALVPPAVTQAVADADIPGTVNGLVNSRVPDPASVPRGFFLGTTGTGVVEWVNRYEMIATGRPDIPSTTPFTSAELNAMAVGTVFRSLDGPQGAWVWRKRPGATGWQVTDGDTGEININHLISVGTPTGDGSFISRTASLVTLILGRQAVSGEQVAGGGPWNLFAIPQGFRGPRDNSFRAYAEHSGTRVRVGGPHMQVLDTITNKALWMTIHWVPGDPWPSTITF